MPEYPSYYSTFNYVGTATASVKTKTFGFIADLVEIESTGGGTFWANLQGAGAASSDDVQFPTGVSKRFEDVPIGAVSFYATGTSTAASQGFHLLALKKRDR